MYSPLNKEEHSGGRYYEYVIENIKALIISGELKSGDKLPPERELAEKFNVSRVPIREALKILEYLGVLDCNSRDGMYVQNITVEDLIGKMNFAFTATSETILELLELRIALETFAAYHAALRRTEEDLRTIRNSVEEMRAAKRTLPRDEEAVQRLRVLSHQFHKDVVSAAHNKVLSGVYDSLYELLDISRQLTISTSGISNNSILAHEAVLDQIVKGDAVQAQQYMAEHLDDVRLMLDNTLAEEDRRHQEGRPSGG